MLSIDHIPSEVSHLNKEEQFDLRQRLVLLIRKKEQPTRQVKLSSISGVGADVWKNIDIDKYLASEREW